MTKANILLGGVVFILGVVAITMLLSPDIMSGVSARTLKSLSYGTTQVKASTLPADQPRAVPLQKPLTPPEVREVMSDPSALLTSPGQEQGATAEITSDFQMKGANTTIKAEDFEDWRVECAQTPAGKNVCQMFQRLLWEDQKSVALVVLVGMGELQGKPVPRMRLIVPLGTFLPTGLVLGLEEAEDKGLRVPIQFCVAQGCVTNIDLDQTVIDKLKNKQNLSTAYIRPDRKTVKLSISLKGFTKALERISRN
ncbi:MAG: invasion associated locus B family protein [Alphaproteobacteria bacterium]|nr:invasion associated locus B family protein [Alphaproteobacteria bacterium]